MNIRQNPFTAFDYHLPVQNWFYPFDEEAEPQYETMKKGVKETLFAIPVSKCNGLRSLYFHIPFCETLCSFCALPKTLCKDNAIFDKYVDCLIEEIKIKSQYDVVSKPKVNAIFFGGGTPSILSPEHILRIGQAIHEHFDLSELKEFSFENNAMSVTREKAAALKSIGVTHPRVGVQTFNPKYRKLFNLSATIDQVKEAVEIYNSMFDYVCIDMIYGMHGQTVDEFIMDINEATSLSTKLIDLYPITNVCTQPKMDADFKAANLEALSGMTKHGYNIIGREVMGAYGYAPHNGHGYVKVGTDKIDRKQVVTDEYNFQYHESHYGYEEDSIVGFGAGAVSIINNTAITNCESYTQYFKEILEDKDLEVVVQVTDDATMAAKGIVMHLPYHGFVSKERINPDRVHKETLEALNLCLENKLVEETNTEYRLTHLGWQWYVALLFFLSSKNQQEALNKAILSRIINGKKRIEECSNKIYY